ncbi:MAG: Glu-tRNA(Gln) amidotransferase subunit GatD [Candidatus ainarchaeum sp.]|nr:Glu-tRNA(Gln) amidotransferase subunit GatD [Candidatus ainarchaeum sp.]
MKIKEFYKKNKVREGDKIQFDFKGQIVEGTIIPTSRNNLIIKFSSGYNAGFDLIQVKKVKKIGESKKVGKTSKIEIKKKPNLPTISLLHTGGTIASRVDYKTGGVYAGFEAEDIAAMFPEIIQKANFESILVSNMMSEDMTLKNYSLIVKAVEKEIKKGVKGIIIGHGTDTLGYSAAFLSFAVENCPIPVIIVGSQRSSDRGSSDAGMNLICATEFITKTNYKGIAICMHNSINDDYCAILSGTKTRKMHTSRRDAFKTINDSPIALINYNTKEITWVKKQEKLEKKMIIKEKFEKKVGLIKTHPGINEKILDFYKKEKYKGLIIEGTGLGHTPIGEKEIFIKKIKNLVDSGCVIGITSQCINGRVNSNVYSNLRKVSNTGAIYCEDMLPETAFIKLSWLLGNYSKEETKKMLVKNLRGEITSYTRIDVYDE